jgi:hypothetical protein
MTILYINTGTSPNAGDGDSIRLAFNKVNANFTYLSTASFGPTGQMTSIVSDTVPIGATTGTIWYDDISGRSFVYYNNTWVDASPLPTSIDLATLKSVVAASGSFTDFQARIAAL